MAKIEDEKKRKAAGTAHGAGSHDVLTKRTEKNSIPSSPCVAASQRRDEHIQKMNQMMRKFSDLGDLKLYAVFSQLISRIKHPSEEVFDILAVKVEFYYCTFCGIIILN